MAKFTDVNTIGTGPQAMFRFISILLSAGWTGEGYGTGSVYSATGAHASATTLANNSAWQRMREPGGRREWTFQRGTTNQAWRTKYSALVRFGGGSPSATQTPFATDEQVLQGAGSDVSPTFTNLFPADSGYRVHIAANSTPIGGCYPFVLFATTTPGSSEAIGALWQEPMAPGSYDPADADPCVVGTGSFSAGISLLPSASRCWLAYGTGGQVWGTAVGANAPFAGSLPPDLVSGKDVNGRPLYTVSSGGTRVKGYGSTIALKGPARSYPATANRATDAYVYLGSLVLPFADATEPGV